MSSDTAMPHGHIPSVNHNFPKTCSASREVFGHSVVSDNKLQDAKHCQLAAAGAPARA
jgi:hypothetical protein